MEALKLSKITVPPLENVETSDPSVAGVFAFKDTGSNLVTEAKVALRKKKYSVRQYTRKVSADGVSFKLNVLVVRHRNPVEDGAS